MACKFNLLTRLLNVQNTLEVKIICRQITSESFIVILDKPVFYSAEKCLHNGVNTTGT